MTKRKEAAGVKDPIAEQEALYRFPYHWFPEQHLQKFERDEKQRLVYELIDKHLISNPPRRYLDVGCGDGRWTTDIHNYLGSVTETWGVDISERAIGFAKLISPELKFDVQPGESTNFAGSFFDLISAIEVIEHVEDKIEKELLEEIHRILRSEGLLILSAPSLNLKLTRHHFRHYSIERLTELLSDTGFSVLEIRGQSKPCYGIKRWLRKRMNLLPVFWKFWRFTFCEVDPEEALNIIVAARPIKNSAR